MEDGVSLIGLLVEVAIKAGQLQAEHPDGLVMGVGWVNQWADHIEKGFYAQFAADGGYRFHGRMEKGGMEKTDACLLQLAADDVLVIGELVTEVFHYV